MSAVAARVREGFALRPIGPHFGLEIHGLDISAPLDTDAIETIKALSFEHGVVIFKGQEITQAQLSAFALQFGGNSNPPPAIAKADAQENNVSRLGTRASGEAPLSGYALAARNWHSDSSWRSVPTWFTILAAAEIPKSGGNTAFADMSSAYAALSPERKTLIEGKQMVHSWRIMREYEPTIPPMGDEAPEPVCHPLVRTINGRKSLYLCGLNSAYVGNTPVERGRALFKELLAHATQPQFIYEHRWQVGDVAMWDNRVTMHKVMDYDRTLRRVMYRAEVTCTEAP